MNPTLVDTELETPPDLDRGGGGFKDPGSDGGGDGGRDPVARFDTYQTVVWVLMIPVVMLFAGLTSSLVIRKGISDDWISIQIPKILWLNTLVLLSSSAALEIARRALETSEPTTPFASGSGSPRRWGRSSCSARSQPGGNWPRKARFCPATRAALSFTF